MGRSLVEALGKRTRSVPARAIDRPQRSIPFRGGSDSHAMTLMTGEAANVHPEAFRANGRRHAVGFHRRACVRHAAHGRGRAAVREPSAVPCRSRRERAALPRSASQSAVAATRRGVARCSRSSQGPHGYVSPTLVRRARRADVELRGRARGRRGARDRRSATHARATSRRSPRSSSSGSAAAVDARLRRPPARAASSASRSVSTELEGKFKLSQNRSAADRARVDRAADGERHRQRRRARAVDGTPRRRAARRAPPNLTP